MTAERICSVFSRINPNTTIKLARAKRDLQCDLIDQRCQIVPELSVVISIRMDTLY